MIIGKYALVTLLIAAIATFVVVAILDWLTWADDLEDASKRTSRRAGGLAIGISGAGIAAAVESLHLLAEVPALVVGIIGALGLGGVIDISPTAFVSITFIGIVLGEALEGARQRRGS